MTSVTGLYARAILPTLKEPMYSYPMLAERVLPGVFKGLYVIGMLATVMSTLSSLMFIAASTIGNDIIGRLSKPELRAENVNRWTRRGLIISATVAVALALVACSTEQPHALPGVDFRQVAQEWARALAARDYPKAHAMTSEAYRRQMTVDQLRAAFEAIVPPAGVAWGPSTWARR